MNNNVYHEGHLKKCTICGKWCDSLSPNTNDFPFSISFSDGSKKWFHTGCFTKDVQEMLKTN
jgi:hypothetical protein